MEIIKKLFRRYFVVGLGAMAQGLFASLIVGLIINQLSQLPALGFLAPFAATVAASSPVVGAAVGAAVAHGLGAKPLVLFSCVAAGAFGYQQGGPVGAYLSSLAAVECGGLVAGKTKFDIILTPFVCIVAGGVMGTAVAPGVAAVMQGIGGAINSATSMSPLAMSSAVAVIVGLALTGPISSAALCIMLGLEGLAAGAATVGGCAHMVGFAVASFGDNGIGGLVAQGLGSSKLQLGNVMRRPQILLAPTVSAAILGPVATVVFGLRNVPTGAGMGTSGLVGQLSTIAAMPEVPLPRLLLILLLVHMAAPAALTLLFDRLLRRLGLVRKGDMKLDL